MTVKTVFPWGRRRRTPRWGEPIVVGYSAILDPDGNVIGVAVPLPLEVTLWPGDTLDVHHRYDYPEDDPCGSRS